MVMVEEGCIDIISDTLKKKEKMNGADPSDVLKQVLERVAHSPKVARDLVQDKRLKQALYSVFNEQRIHQILAMDSQALRKYRSDQQGLNRSEIVSEVVENEWEDEDGGEDDEWTNDDDCGYSKVVISQDEFNTLLDGVKSDVSDEEEYEEAYEDGGTTDDEVEEAVHQLKVASPINIANQLFDVKSAASSISPTYIRTSFSISPGSDGGGPTAALWPRNPNDFAFSQEEDELVEDSDEAYSELGVISDELDRCDLKDEIFALDEESEIREHQLVFTEKPFEDIKSKRLSRFGLEEVQLKLIREKNHTGFEASKNFEPKPDQIIAGRYQVVNEIGEAAFSTTYKCVDRVTAYFVCLKVIKNNKDFFDQGLDEIQVLKYLAASGDVDEVHVVRLLDSFYYREHLIIVLELLQDNLYDFYRHWLAEHEENYFTLPRIRKIMRESLQALSYIHSLDLIHCDLKPENIVLHDSTTCDVKIIDFGSSCFTSDESTSYIQSRSYRAPEVMLGLDYGQKIDIWSLGCIAAELYTGRVLFSNESISTLWARIIAILGNIPRKMLQEGRYTSKYFASSQEIYHRTRDNEIVLLKPKRTSLWHRLSSPDAGFVDFVADLLQIDPRKRPTADQALQHAWLYTEQYD